MKRTISCRKFAPFLEGSLLPQDPLPLGSLAEVTLLTYYNHLTLLPYYNYPINLLQLPYYPTTIALLPYYSYPITLLPYYYYCNCPMQKMSIFSSCV